MLHDYISIDQNSHPLWDVVPKLHALSAQNKSGLHCIEDVDVAFTRRGASAGDPLKLEREQYYRGGVSDWGAALFYTNFLGRNMFDVRDLEPYTGITTAALSRKLNFSVDELYAEYSPSDNHQLTGPSYLENPEQHRTIGDISAEEIAPFLPELLSIAQTDMLERFPEEAAQERIKNWFSEQLSFVESLLKKQHNHGRMVDIYTDWMNAETDERTEIRTTSEIFGIDSMSEAQLNLLIAFTSNFEELATLYNEAIDETDSSLNKLHIKKGELPFFAVRTHNGRMIRTGLFLNENTLSTPDGASWKLTNNTVPLEQMKQDGVINISGKALLLVTQARLSSVPCSLALPYNGSLYMPTAHCLAQKLAEQNIIPIGIHPITRVKFNFLEAMRDVSTIIKLPEHLHSAFSKPELPAQEFAEEIPRAIRKAQTLLEQFKSEEGRENWEKQTFGKIIEETEALEQKRRALVRNPETRDQAKTMWKTIKQTDLNILKSQIDAIIQAHHIIDLDYWNSRGALLPWSIALGGNEFYQKLIETAEIYPETHEGKKP